MTEAAMLVVRGLGKSVPGPRRLFSGLNPRVASGELVAIIGESGAANPPCSTCWPGSTMPTRAARRSTAPNSACWLKRRTRPQRERIGFVFQALHILPYLTLRQDVALPLALVSADAAAGDARADAMIASVGLATRGDGFPRAFAERTFRQLEGFGSYGFPESHAALFAKIA